MKTQLSFLKQKASQVFLLFLMLFSMSAFGQTTLAHFPLAGNTVAATNTVGASVALSASTTWNNNRVYFDESADNIILSANTTTHDNLYITFNTRGDFPWYSLWTDVIVEYRIGGTGSWLNVQTFSIGESANLRTVDLPAAVSNINNLQIRIRFDTGWWGDDKVWIDDLKLLKKTANIMLYTAGNTPIPHLSAASMTYTTDFGTVEPTDPSPTNTFRVRNYNGTSGSVLNVSSIVVEGSHASDFTVTPTSISNISNVTSINDNTNNFKTFTVTFTPQGDGVRTAEIKLYSNSAPSPYIFTVVGIGASCSLESKPHRENTAGVGGSNILTLDANYSNTDLVTGIANPANQNSLGIRLYPDGNLYTSAAQSLLIRDMEKTFSFGGATGVDIVGLKEVSVEFNLAAFTVGDGNGVSNNAFIYLDVFNPNTSTWSREMILKGADTYWWFGTQTNYYKYDFVGGSPFTATYDGNNSANETVNTNSTKYKKFKLNIPFTSGIENLRFRIVAKTDGNSKLWLIDDVQVKSGTAVFKTFTTGNVWSPSAPTPNQKAVIQGDYTVPSGNLSICECEVETAGKVTIPANRVLTVRNKITNNGSNFIVANDANLIQIENGAINTGNITVQKVFTFSTGRQQYNYVTSPTVDTNVKSIYTGALDNSLSALYYIESNDRFGISGGNYIAGRGLALQEKSTGTDGTSANPAKFVGVPFNGVINYPLAFTNAAHGYNLVGNPYPSNLDIENLYDANAAKIDATFYFWDNRGNTQFTQQGSGYNGDNYAKYNAVAGTGVGAGIKAPSIPVASARIPNRYVKVGTGFLVQAKSAGQTLDFSNTMRSSDNTGPGFFGKSTENEEKDRYWLSLKTPSEMEFMNAVVYLPNGSKAMGPEDTETFGGSDDIFTIVGDKNLAIQGRDQFENNDQLNVGVRLFQAGTHTISIYDKEGVFANGQNIYLKDKQTGVITNLSENSYTFTANAGINTGRFEIIYKPETVLVTDSAVKDQVIVYRDQDNFIIESPKVIATVEMYDLSGKLMRVLKPNHKQAILDASSIQRGVYILLIKGKEGDVSNKKILK